MNATIDGLIAVWKCSTWRWRITQAMDMPEPQLKMLFKELKIVSAIDLVNALKKGNQQ